MSLEHSQGKLSYSLDEFHKMGGPCRTNSYKEINAGNLIAYKDGRRTKVTHENAVKYINSRPQVQPAGAE